jgi:hypothetical protein
MLLNFACRALASDSRTFVQDAQEAKGLRYAAFSRLMPGEMAIFSPVDR